VDRFSVQAEVGAADIEESTTAMSAGSPFIPQRVLVTKFRHHGDVLLTTPLIRALHHYYPGVEVDALIYRETEDMLRHNPQVAHRWTIDRNWKKEGVRAQVKHEWRLWRELKARRYDLLIHLTETWRGAALARGLGIRSVSGRSIAFDYPRRDNLFWRRAFTDLVPLPESPCHNVALQLSTLTALGLTPNAEDFPLSLTVDETARTNFLDALRRTGWQGEPYLLIHPGARWFFKCWEDASFAALIDALTARGHTIVLTGAPGARETAMADNILKDLKYKTRVHSLVGQLSLAELAAAIGGAQFFIGVDSVPINFLNPIPGTPFAKRPTLSADEGLRIIAMFRLLLPKASIRICGGRPTTFGKRQSEILTAGVDALMTGDYLTTSGVTPESDFKMVSESLLPSP
jgi:heptosyltransferase-3